VLAIFVGFELITKVPPLLHTPLMSGSNAISGITIIGAMLSVATPSPFSTVLGFIAIVFATVNVVGGFLVTHRMLGMFSGRRADAVNQDQSSISRISSQPSSSFRLKGLSHPRTAVRGNMLGACGMLLAVIATFLYRDILGVGPMQAS
jgi:H+-translocating NAD(P) transhydrogenase subunit alpha